MDDLLFIHNRLAAHAVTFCQTLTLLLHDFRV
jgi:hypothetical protein